MVMKNTEHTMEAMPAPEKILSFAEAKDRLASLDLTAKIGRKRTRLDLASGAVAERPYEEELWDLDEEAFKRIGAQDVSRMLDRLEADFKERELLVSQFKKYFQEANQNNLVERYLRLFVIPERKGEKDFWDENYFIESYAYELLRGELDFLERFDLDALRKISDEFGKFVKGIDIKKLEEKEEEERIQAGKEKFKAEKGEKENLVGSLSTTFYYKEALLREIADYLSMRIDSDKARDLKGLKNQFQNMKLEALRKIKELYSKIVKNTETFSGNIHSEEDLLFGLEDLREG